MVDVVVGGGVKGVILPSIPYLTTEPTKNPGALGQDPRGQTTVVA